MKAGLEKNLIQHLEKLTSIRPHRNFEHPESLNEAAFYIQGYFEGLGMDTSEQRFRAWNREYRNIRAFYGPRDASRLVVGAHYDVCGEQPGADDNASGVAGLLELGRMLSENRPALANTIELVAYSLEEPPFFGTDKMGSAIHAQSLRRDRISVTGMICLEMIGYFSEEPASQQYPDPVLETIYPDRGNFIVVVGLEKQSAFTQEVYRLIAQASELDVQWITFADGHELAYLSDQRNYFARGYKAVMINDTSFLRNPHYHCPTDEWQTLDIPKMAEVVKGVYAAMTSLPPA